MLNDNPFFSVIVPVYNVQKYINECLDSILCQSYKNLEIIIVDDGSPDLCPAICDEYVAKDRRVKVIHQTNQGLSQARNTGIKAATGDYLLFVDSDDMLANSEALEQLADFLDRNNSTVTYCHGVAKFENGDKEFDITSSIKEELLLKPDDLISFKIKNKYRMAAWTFVIRRDFIFKHSLFFYPGIFYEDIEWFPRLLLTEPGLKVNIFSKPYYLYRNNPTSITHSFGKSHFESYIKVLALFKEQMQTFPKSYFLESMLNLALYCMFSFFEDPCLSNSPFFTSSLPTIKSLFRQNYHLLNLRNKILYLFILFSPKAFFVLRKWIKKARRD